MVSDRRPRVLARMRIVIFCVGILSVTLSASCTSVRVPAPASAPPIRDQIDLSGEWEFQDEGTAQRIALDEKGNGSYRWQNGHIVTTSVSSAAGKATGTKRETIARAALKCCSPAMEGRRTAPGGIRASGPVTSRLAS